MKRFLFSLSITLLTACAGIPSPLERSQNLDALAAARNWQKLRVPTETFVLAAYVPEVREVDEFLAVYIEGDGMAWVTSSRPSDNPTPRTPVSLQLALQHPHGLAVYLGRPCQNIADADWGRCKESYWTNNRYGPEVIEASNQAISALKARFGARKLVLVGYSGGGAVAALVAARRDDVVRLVTVAANLDIAAWTSEHRILPLSGSLNPADSWERLQRIPQTHFVGGKDAVVGAKVVGAYLARFPASVRPRMRIFDDFTHGCCWAEQWPWLAQEAFPDGKHLQP